MFESHNQPVAPLSVFLPRLVCSIALGLIIVFIGLAIGMIGYTYFEPMSLTDAFTNSALILSDMGPIKLPAVASGKLFVAIYSLFSGLAFVSIVGVILAPILHRLCHQFLYQYNPHQPEKQESP
ncbi:MAG: hypothetical protein P4M14_09655 [Gammaproteobacteria bacterium]|nr:hypothetical protein [Gammaproteobacteria bacterium]